MLLLFLAIHHVISCFCFATLSSKSQTHRIHEIVVTFPGRISFVGWKSSCWCNVQIFYFLLFHYCCAKRSGHQQTVCSGSPAPQGQSTATTTRAARWVLQRCSCLVESWLETNLLEFNGNLVGGKVLAPFMVTIWPWSMVTPVLERDGLHKLHPHWGRILWDWVEGEQRHINRFVLLIMTDAAWCCLRLIDAL